MPRVYREQALHHSGCSRLLRMFIPILSILQTGVTGTEIGSVRILEVGSARIFERLSALDDVEHRL